MSVVCCKVTKKYIEIAADSQVTWGGVKFASGNTTRTKLVKVNGMILGSVGSAEDGSLFQVFCMTHKPAGTREDDILAFVVDFVEWKNIKTKKYEINYSYILIFNKHAFEINGFEVNEILTYSALGHGRDFSLAAIFLGCSLRRAIQVASKFDLYCSEPITYFKVERS